MQGLKLSYFGMVLAIVASLFSCKEPMDPPTFIISFTQEYMSYMVPGTLGVPELFNERGAPDYFTLITPDECKDGYFLNEQTGEISWDSSLPYGRWNIKLTAHNEAGSDSRTIGCFNALRGTFKGRRQNPDGSFLDEEPFTLKIGHTQYFIDHPEYGHWVGSFPTEKRDSYTFDYPRGDLLGFSLFFVLETIQIDDDLLLKGTWENIYSGSETGNITFTFEP